MDFQVGNVLSFKFQLQDDPQGVTTYHPAIILGIDHEEELCVAMMCTSKHHPDNPYQYPLEPWDPPMEKPTYFLLDRVEVFHFSSVGRKGYGVLHPAAFDEVMRKFKAYERMMKARGLE